MENNWSLQELSFIQTLAAMKVCGREKKKEAVRKARRREEARRGRKSKQQQKKKKGSKNKQEEARSKKVRSNRRSRSKEAKKQARSKNNSKQQGEKKTSKKRRREGRRNDEKRALLTLFFLLLFFIYHLQEPDSVVLQNVLSTYGTRAPVAPHSETLSSDRWAIDLKKLAVYYAVRLLSQTQSGSGFPLQEFMESWANCLPDEFTPTLELLRVAEEEKRKKKEQTQLSVSFCLFLIFRELRLPKMLETFRVRFARS